MFEKVSLFFFVHLYVHLYSIFESIGVQACMSKLISRAHQKTLRSDPTAPVGVPRTSTTDILDVQSLPGKFLGHGLGSLVQTLKELHSETHKLSGNGIFILANHVRGG